MNPMPIGKRTRLQRAIQERHFREMSKRARLEARARYRQDMSLVVIDDDDEEEAAQIVDEEEYNRRGDAFTPDVLPNANENVGGNHVVVGHDNADESGYDSDESCMFIRQTWNPLIFGDYDDIDDDSDEDDAVVVGVPTTTTNDSGGDGEEKGQSSGDVDVTSSEDDEIDKDKDFQVDEKGNDSSSDNYSSSSEYEGTSDEEYRAWLRERRKSLEGKEGGQEAKERRKERRRKRKERDNLLYDENLVDMAETPESKGRKREKRARVSREDVLDRLVSSIGPGNDGEVGDVFVGLKKANSEPRNSVKMVKGSDRVFRKVAVSRKGEKGEVGGKTGSSRSVPNRSDKRRNVGDSVSRRAVGSSRQGGIVIGRRGTNESDLNHSAKVRKGGDEVFGKAGGSSHRAGGTDNLDTNGDVIMKKSKDGVWRKVVPNREKDPHVQITSHDDDVEEPRKSSKKERFDEEGGDMDKEKSKKASDSRSLSRRKRKEKATEVQNTILDTILEEGKGVAEESMSTPTPTEYFYLPLKFSFRPKDMESKKSEEEIELENLFKELSFALQASQMGFDEPLLNDDQTCSDPPATEGSEKTSCAGGKHHLIHDEEIGIYCRFCSYMFESKYVTPDFNKDIFRRSSKTRPQSDDKIGDGIQIPDPSENAEESHQSKIVQGTVWELIPGTWRTLYPHQREGFEFIWKNVAGGIKIDELERPSKYGVGGCIICHAPGTGKTRLAIVFIQSFLKQYQFSRPVIIAPRTMLRTWQEEFARWKVDIPFFNLNDDELSGKEDAEVMSFVASFKHRTTIRLAKISTWANGKGILGISYGLYEKLVNESSKDKKIRDALLTRPGLMVLDEGHTPRNDKSNIWKALQDVSTKRKVILSGTPFQNNFDELSNTLSLVREEFGVPIKQGSYIQDERKIQELRNKIGPFVHVHKGEILKETLKGLFATLIILSPSKLQERCFAAIGRQTNFTGDNLVSLASVHPSIFCENRPSFIDAEWAALLETYKDDLDAGVKSRFLFELIRLSEGERVLVFGQFLPPLNFIAGLLKSRFHWEMGRELLYMDGQQDTKERQNTIRFFNDPKSEARVLLASTKACCEGIHLVGASRVVLLDVVWNPSVERQAISRAYRLGQKKDVYVYHLLSGTREEQKYRRQATKERLSEMVFSPSEGKCIQNANEGSKFFVDKVLEAMLDHEKLKTKFQKIVYQPKADILIDSFGGPLNL